MKLKAAALAVLAMTLTGTAMANNCEHHHHYMNHDSRDHRGAYQGRQENRDDHGHENYFGPNGAHS